MGWRRDSLISLSVTFHRYKGFDVSPGVAEFSCLAHFLDFAMDTPFEITQFGSSHPTLAHGAVGRFHGYWKRMVRRRGHV
jgi:hypothetical protein